MREIPLTHPLAIRGGCKFPFIANANVAASPFVRRSLIAAAELQMRCTLLIIKENEGISTILSHYIIHYIMLVPSRAHKMILRARWGLLLLSKSFRNFMFLPRWLYAKSNTLHLAIRFRTSHALRSSRIVDLRFFTVPSPQIARWFIGLMYKRINGTFIVTSLEVRSSPFD